MMSKITLRRLAISLIAAITAMPPAIAQKASPGVSTGTKADNSQAPNPYRLTPFHPDFPSTLEYPPMISREYDRTRRQVLKQLASNLQGNVRREAWQIATEFYWRAPEDAVEPLSRRVPEEDADLRAAVRQGQHGAEHGRVRRREPARRRGWTPGAGSKRSHGLHAAHALLHGVELTLLEASGFVELVGVRRLQIAHLDPQSERAHL